MYLLVRSLGVSGSGAFVASAVFIMQRLRDGHSLSRSHEPGGKLHLAALGDLFRSTGPCMLDRILAGCASIAGALWGIQILAGAPPGCLLHLSCRNPLSSLHDQRRPGDAEPLRPNFLPSPYRCLWSEQVFHAFRSSLPWNSSMSPCALPWIPTSGPRSPPTRFRESSRSCLPHFFGNYADGSVWVSNTPWSHSPAEPLHGHLAAGAPGLCVASREALKKG